MDASIDGTLLNTICFCISAHLLIASFLTSNGSISSFKRKANVPKVCGSQSVDQALEQWFTRPEEPDGEDIKQLSWMY
jgi:hypothetical protein